MGHCLKWTDVGRSCPLQAVSFPKWVILDCSRVRKLTHTQTSRHACISPCSIVGVMLPGASWHCHCGVPTMMDGIQIARCHQSIPHSVAYCQGHVSQQWKRKWDAQKVLLLLFKVFIFFASPWETSILRVLKDRDLNVTINGLNLWPPYLNFPCLYMGFWCINTCIHAEFLD